MLTYHRWLEIDRVVVLAVEVRREWSWEIGRPGAGLRVDGEEGRALFVFRMLSGRY